MSASRAALNRVDGDRRLVRAVRLLYRGDQYGRRQRLIARLVTTFLAANATFALILKLAA